MIEQNQQRCGLIAVLGAPNAGKSTFVNAAIGSKISIVSHKVQTTRRRVTGIMVHNMSQIIFLDTPGIFAPQKKLDRAMVHAAWSSIEDTDFNLVLTDASAPSQQTTYSILDRLQDHAPTTPIILVLNKIDNLPREKLLPIAQKFAEKYPFIAKFFMISARTKSGIKDLLNDLASSLKQTPWLYPEDQMTDLPLRLWSAELTREKVYQYLHAELPYAITVETEQWENFDNGAVRVTQTIHVERPLQKAIVLGKNGQMLRHLGSKTRQEMIDFLQTPVHLILNVRVTPNWSDDPYHYDMQGLKRPK